VFCILETVFALFAAYGVVFFCWWIVAICYARHLSENVSFSEKSKLRYINWLKFAGIFPPKIKKEDPNGTGIDDN